MRKPGRGVATAAPLVGTSSVSATHLLGLRADAVRTRRRYLAKLRRLPAPLGSLCADFYTQRVTRVRPKPLLGEYLPWLLADLLAIPSRVTERIVEGWLGWYLHVMAIDDLLDGPREAGPLLPIVAGVFAEQGHLAFVRELGSDAQFWNPLDRYLLRMAAAGAREIEDHRGKVTSISARDFEGLGQKIELVKVCYFSLVLAAKIKPQRQHLEALEDFAVGIQVFDDISDWEEDLAVGNFTPLLSVALRDIGGNRRAPSHEEVLLRLVETEALATCVEEGASRLSRAATASGFRPDAAGTRLLQSLAADLRALDRTRITVAGVIKEQRALWPDLDDERLVRVARLRAALSGLASHIRTVAQSS